MLKTRRKAHREKQAAESACESSAVDMLLQQDEHVEYQQYNSSSRFHNIQNTHRKAEEITTWDNGFKTNALLQAKPQSNTNQQQRKYRNQFSFQGKSYLMRNQNKKITELSERLQLDLRREKKRRLTINAESHRQRCVISIVSPDFKAQHPAASQKESLQIKTSTNLHMKKLQIKQNFNERKKLLIKKIKKELIDHISSTSDKKFNYSTLTPFIQTAKNIEARKTPQENILHKGYFKFTSKGKEESGRQAMQEELQIREEKANTSRSIRNYMHLKSSSMKYEKEKLKQKPKRFKSEVLNSTNEFKILKNLLRLQKNNNYHAAMVTQY